MQCCVLAVSPMLFVLQIMNMKPAEILSLLEEASGTKLYERKKDQAVKTLAKKQTKLDEIDQVSKRCSMPQCSTAWCAS